MSSGQPKQVIAESSGNDVCEGSEDGKSLSSSRNSHKSNMREAEGPMINDA